MRPVFLIALMGTLSAHAQLGEKLRGLWATDPQQAPDHDTAYIAQYRSNIQLSAVVQLQSVDVDIDQSDDRSLGYSLNALERYGLALDYKWLSLEALFTVKSISDYDASLGESSSKGIGFGITHQRLWLRGLWNTSQGYYLNNAEQWTGMPGQYVRPDIKNRIFLLSANYALSGKRRYSHSAAMYQTERQKKSAGTFVVGGSAWHTTLSADSSLLSDALLDTFRLASRFTGVQRLMIGASFGYTHTFVFWHKGFIQAAMFPGLTYTNQWIDTPQERLHGKGIATVLESRVGAGYNGKTWFCSITGAYYYATTNIADDLNMGLNYGTVRITLGMRFGDPGIKALEKVGL